MHRIQRGIFLAVGAICVCFGFWCLYLAFKFGLWAIKFEAIPIDMRASLILSFFVLTTFFFILSLSGIFSIYHGMRLDNEIGKSVFLPTLPKLLVVVFLILLSFLALSNYQPTTKITWEEQRGAPIAYLTVTELRGPCLAGIAFWKCRFYNNFEYAPFFENTIVFYYSVCLGILAFDKSKGG